MATRQPPPRMLRAARSPETSPSTRSSRRRPPRERTLPAPSWRAIATRVARAPSEHRNRGSSPTAYYQAGVGCRVGCWPDGERPTSWDDLKGSKRGVHSWVATRAGPAVPPMSIKLVRVRDMRARFALGRASLPAWYGGSSRPWRSTSSMLTSSPAAAPTMPQHARQHSKKMRDALGKTCGALGFGGWESLGFRV